MKKNRTISLYNSPEILNAIDDLKEQGVTSSFVAKTAIKEYIIKYYPEVAKRNKL
ncbi:hypothetical protein HLA87_02400 [Mycoplasma miroungigenitalium]|uniref:Ribbon-helix-helix protein CopG domain-containing protein n=1 Tax=Mycoplasma miroungigenitalium TaxID=754515 RepID=A0A6M4JB62_9MOLU|nr:hypothetical protein [Mycoplasma miroungigenitalium]QJR43625.1 hypothetical protein HLA87_02400 [Mycoplasma miroungigenitalium]